MASTKKNPISTTSKRRPWLIMAVVIAAVAALLAAIVTMRPTAEERLAEKTDFSQFDGLAVEFIDSDEATEDGVIVFSADGGANDGAGVVNIAEDPYCSHCADMNEVAGDALVSKVKSGDLVARLHLAAITDGMDNDRGPSHTANAAIASAARAGDAAAAWGTLEMVYRNGDKTLPMSLGEYKGVMEAAGATDATLEMISDEDARFEDAKTMWAGSGEYMQEHAGKIATPVIFDGSNKKIESFDITKDDWVYAVSAAS